MTDSKRKIFLAPVSSSALYKNYQKSVMIGFDKNDFLNLKYSKKYENLLSHNYTVRIWGIKSVKLTPYNKVSIGDTVLFYHKGFMVGRAIISFKDSNRNLSEKLWGNDFDKLKNKLEYWENLMFLEKFTVINLNFKILIDYASFSPKASVRGFNEYPQSAIEKILKDYKTIENFIKKYK